MAVTLTDRSLRRLVATAARRQDVWDSSISGFGVRISPGGHCSFVVRYRVSGRLRRLTLGPYPRITLADARQSARDALRDAHYGKDHAAEKIEARQAETFADLAREYIERHASKKRSGREDIRLLNGSPHKKRTGKKPHVGLVTRWGTRKVNDIKRRDVRELLNEIAARAPIMANRTLDSSARCATSGFHPHSAPARAASPDRAVSPSGRDSSRATHVRSRESWRSRRAPDSRLPVCL